MKTNSFYFLFFLLFIASSCTDDTIDEEKPKGDWTEENEWIYDTMIANYLWYDEINSNKIDPAADAETFFYSLLSNKDGKTSVNSHYYYSYIEENNGSRAYMGDGLTFGIEYQAWQIQDLNNRICLQILYVLPGSAAAIAGLKRGDWIFTLNGSNVQSNYYTLLNSSSTITLGVGENLASYNKVLTPHTLTATTVEDNPIFVSRFIEGTNVGYMAYNHFTTGPDGSNDRTYDIQIVKELTKLKGMTDFVLDLRYNPGGYVSSAQVLSSCLVPSNHLDDIFCKMTYNDKRTRENRSLSFLKSIENINGTEPPVLSLNRVFIITSSRSASASELVIASLKPYFGDKLYIIGDKNSNTEGKNVGSLEYTDDKYDWILHPIVCHVTNRDDLDYSNGFPPTSGLAYSYSDEAGDEQLYDLGDPRDGALKLALEYITGSRSSSSVGIKAESTSLLAIPLESSLDQRRTKGMILD